MKSLPIELVISEKNVETTYIEISKYVDIAWSDVDLDV